MSVESMLTGTTTIVNNIIQFRTITSYEHNPVSFASTPRFSDAGNSDSNMLNSTSSPDIDSATNMTSIPEEGDFAMPIYAQALIILMYSTITVLSVGGNMIVVYIIIAYQRMRTVTNYFIVNLACGDFLMASLCIPFTFIATVLMNYWPFGAVMCPIVLYAQGVSVFLSAFTLVAISVDRYIAVIYPLRPRMTTQQAAIIISAIWILALTVPLPVIVLADTTADGAGVGRPTCEEKWPNQQQRYIYSLLIMVLQYFLPLFVLMFTYTRIGVVIWIKRIPGEAENNRDQRIAASKRKMVKMMLTVVIIYALCWLPLHTVTLVGDRHGAIWNFKYIKVVWTSCHWLAMSSCCYNPMVYCWMNSTFRNGFRYVLRCLPCINLNVNPNSNASSGKRQCLSTQTSNTCVSTIRSSCLPDILVGWCLKSSSTSDTEGDVSNVRKNHKEMKIYPSQRQLTRNGHYNAAGEGSKEQNGRQLTPASRSNKPITDGMTKHITAAECEPLTCT